jgi:hypothetical protein
MVMTMMLVVAVVSTENIRDGRKRILVGLPMIFDNLDDALLRNLALIDDANGSDFADETGAGVVGMILCIAGASRHGQGDDGDGDGTKHESLLRRMLNVSIITINTLGSHK